MVCRLLAGKGNRTGAILFSSRIERMIPARGGGGTADPARRADPASQSARSPGHRSQEVLSDAAGLIKRRSLIFIVSDFICAPGWEKPLGQLASRHDVIAVRPVIRSKCGCPIWAC